MSDLTLSAKVWASLCNELGNTKQFTEACDLWQVPSSVAVECMGAPGKELAIYTRYLTQGKITTHITANHLEAVRAWLSEKKSEGWEVEWGMS